MKTKITMPEKDAARLDGMLDAIKTKPESASEFLTYAYGLGFCEGRAVTAKQLLDEITRHSPDAASNPPISTKEK